MSLNTFDAIIIGGSYSGLSAAMSLGRSLRKVLVIDAGKPCNRQTPRSHNFLTHDGTPPAEISALARKQVGVYDTVTFINDFATHIAKTDAGFQLTVASGETYFGNKVIFATGIVDEIPRIKGFAQCWGISIIHCPYCHGYEFRNQKTGIMANGDRAFHLASMVHNLSQNLTILTQGPAEFSNEQWDKLGHRNIEIVEAELHEVIHENGHIKALHFDDRSPMTFDAVYAALPFSQSTDLPTTLGCQLTEEGYIQVDGFQKTTIDGVFACGDNSTFMRSVAHAVASGNVAGAMVNKALIEERF